jgi:hypothetical protein
MTSKSNKGLFTLMCISLYSTNGYETRPQVASRGSSSVTAMILGDATTHAKLISKRYYSTTYLQLHHHYDSCYSAHQAHTLFAQARNQHSVAEGNL